MPDQLYVPRDTPIDKLCLVVKIMYGIKLQDKRWDRENYARTKKACKKIYQFFEDSELGFEPVAMSLKCMEDLTNHFKSKGMCWTIETVDKWKADWERQFGKYGKFRELQYGL
jgi:hypothetical protein